MNDEMRAQDEKILGKLNWLVGRTKTDFKGNPSPVAKKKTKQSIEKSKKESDKLLQGGIFAPYGHNVVPLAMDATRVRSSSGDIISVPDLGGDHHSRNKYHQVLDSRTKRPEIYDAMQPMRAETHKSPVRGRRRFPEAGVSTSVKGSVFSRPSARDVDLATAQERLQLLRADALEHPKFTGTSRFVHACDYWDPSSQLGPNPTLDPPQKNRAPLIKRRNEVRMVSILRRTGAATAWK